MNFLNHIATRLRELGPYFLVELLLPGGTVLALLLWWHRHRHNGAASNEAHGFPCKGS